MKRCQRNLIRGMRGVLELSQSQLSAMTGLSASRICRIEKGTFPIRAEEAALIGEALGLSAGIIQRQQGINRRRKS